MAWWCLWSAVLCDATSPPCRASPTFSVELVVLGAALTLWNRFSSSSEVWGFYEPLTAPSVAPATGKWFYPFGLHLLSRITHSSPICYCLDLVAFWCVCFCYSIIPLCLYSCFNCLSISPIPAFYALYPSIPLHALLLSCNLSSLLPWWNQLVVLLFQFFTFDCHLCWIYGSLNLVCSFLLDLYLDLITFPCNFLHLRLMSFFVSFCSLLPPSGFLVLLWFCSVFQDHSYCPRSVGLGSWMVFSRRSLLPILRASAHDIGVYGLV